MNQHEGYNPAWHFEKFFDLLSYRTAWGQTAEMVVPEWRDKKIPVIPLQGYFCSQEIGLFQNRCMILDE